MNVTKGSSILDELMVAPPKYALWKMVIIGGLASAAIIPSGELLSLRLSFLDIHADMSPRISFLRIFYRHACSDSSRRSLGRGASPACSE